MNRRVKTENGWVRGSAPQLIHALPVLKASPLPRRLWVKIAGVRHSPAPRGRMIDWLLSTAPLPCRTRASPAVITFGHGSGR